MANDHMLRPIQFVAGALILLASLASVASAQGLGDLDQSVDSQSLDSQSFDNGGFENGDSDNSNVDADRKIELVQERYPNRLIKVEREVALDSKGNYINHGKWIYRDTAGNIVAEGQYRDHRRQGAWHRLHHRADSQLLSQAPFHLFAEPFRSTATFELGKLHGTWTISDAKQRKVCEIQFDHGVRHGTAIWHLANGRKMRETTFDHGVIDGQLKEWSADGKPKLSHTYRQGRRIASKAQRYSATQKKSDGMYLFAKRVAKTKDDWWNARIATYTTEGKDERHGRWTSWYDSGQMKQKGEFENDKPVGASTWWFANGQESTSGSYTAGKKDGRWVWWHTNGQKRAIGHFQNGVSAGKWSWWRTDGRLVRSETHSDGDVSNVTIAPGQSPVDVGTAPRRLDSSRRTFKR